MSYDRPEDRVVSERDREVVVTQSGGNTGMAMLAGVLIVLAIIFLVWLLGNNDGATTTTGSPGETTAPVEQTTTAPTETTLPTVTTTAP